jgi:hypothetical protein
MVAVRADPQHVHVFDPRTGQAIANQGQIRGA